MGERTVVFLRAVCVHSLLFLLQLVPIQAWRNSSTRSPRRGASSMMRTMTPAPRLPSGVSPTPPRTSPPPAPLLSKQVPPVNFPACLWPRGHRPLVSCRWLRPRWCLERTAQHCSPGKACGSRSQQRRRLEQKCRTRVLLSTRWSLRWAAELV